MSAPDTNVKRQASRHRWPLIGIAAVVVFGGLMALLITIQGMNDPGAPVEELPQAAPGAQEQVQPELAPPGAPAPEVEEGGASDPAVIRTVDPEGQSPQADPTND